MGGGDQGPRPARGWPPTPDFARAYAAVVSSVPAPENMAVTPKGQPVSVLFMNGTADPINPWQGGDVVLWPVLGNRGRAVRAGERRLLSEAWRYGPHPASAASRSTPSRAAATPSRVPPRTAGACLAIPTGTSTPQTRFGSSSSRWRSEPPAPDEASRMTARR